MHSIASSVLVGATLLLSGNSLKADWDSWAYTQSSGSTGSKFFKIDSSSRDSSEVLSFGDSDKLKFFDTTYQSWYGINSLKMNTATGDLEYKTSENCPGKTAQYQGTSTDPNCSSVYQKWSSINLDTGTRTEIYEPWYGSYTSKGERPSISRGTDGSMTLQQEGKTIIGKKGDGEIHLGENSWITKEENGRQNVYAKDAEGNSITIDYTNGTRLLINGRDVDQVIDNVVALSAALRGLPTVPQDSPLACGNGAGAHSGSKALSGGCAS